MSGNKEENSKMADSVDKDSENVNSQTENSQEPKDIQKDNSNTPEDKSAKNNGPLPDTPGNVTPGFILTADIGNMDGYTLCLLLNEQMGGAVVEGVQEVRGLWRVYMNTLKLTYAMRN